MGSEMCIRDRSYIEYMMNTGHKKLATLGFLRCSSPNWSATNIETLRVGLVYRDHAEIEPPIRISGPIIMRSDVSPPGANSALLAFHYEQVPHNEAHTLTSVSSELIA